MTREQILKKCIEKAVKGGWEKDLIWDEIKIKKVTTGGFFEFAVWDSPIHKAHINEILFDHSFLIALFGKELVCRNCGISLKKSAVLSNCKCAYGEIEKWKYCGCKIFLAKDRLKYMEQFIE